MHEPLFTILQAKLYHRSEKGSTLKIGMKSSMIASLRFARRVASGTLQVCCCSRMLSTAPFRLLHLSLINACDSEHAAAKSLKPGSCCS